MPKIEWSNLPPTLRDHLFDRLLDRATVLRFTGKSFRQPHDVQGAALDE